MMICLFIFVLLCSSLFIFSHAARLYLAVMADGRVGEYGPPHALLSQPGSQLSALAASTGVGAEAQLKQLAAEADSRRKKEPANLT